MCAAPEVIDNHRYTFSPDWWGLGCVVYEMIAGECPFRKRKERASREVIEKRVRESSITYSSKFTPEASLFVSQLLERNSSNRLGRSGRGFQDVKSHPFFQQINWKHLDAGVCEPPFTPNVSGLLPCTHTHTHTHTHHTHHTSHITLSPHCICYYPISPELCMLKMYWTLIHSLRSEELRLRNQIMSLLASSLLGRSLNHGRMR